MATDEYPELPKAWEIKRRFSDTGWLGMEHAFLAEHPPLLDLLVPFAGWRESAKGVLVIAQGCMIYYWGENPNFSKSLIDRLLRAVIKVISADSGVEDAAIAYLMNLNHPIREGSKPPQ